MGKSRFWRRNYGKISSFGGGIITTSKNYGGIITTYAKIQRRKYGNSFWGNYRGLLSIIIWPRDRASISVQQLRIIIYFPNILTTQNQQKQRKRSINLKVF
jgi:hypothetical protein